MKNYYLLLSAYLALNLFCKEHKGYCDNCPLVFFVTPETIMPCPYKTLLERMKHLEQKEATK